MMIYSNPSSRVGSNFRSLDRIHIDLSVWGGAILIDEEKKAKEFWEQGTKHVIKQSF